jgi:ribosomal-protein-alanine N-acetyltransferase
MAIQSISSTSIEPAGHGTRWHQRLPELRDTVVLLRQLRRHDAVSLLRHVNRSSVLQYIAQCPSTVDGFQRFIRWTHVERRRGYHACYGIVPADTDLAIGIFQLWWTDRKFSTAEWGFAVGEAYWGTGVATRAAQLFLDALFVDQIFGDPSVFRLEARAAAENARGNAFLKKLGATREGTLRGGFREGNRISDYVMWSILAPEWIQRRGSDHSAKPCLAR